MQPEMSALLRAVLLEPESDDPRLQYADILEESGTDEAAARGRFVRIQCLLATLDVHDADYPGLVAQERAILDEYWREWVRTICLASGEPLPIAPRPDRPDRWWWSWRGLRWRHEIFAPRPAEIWHIEWSGLSQRGHAIRPVRYQPPPWLSELEFGRGFVRRVSLNHKSFRGAGHLRNVFERTPVEVLAMTGFPAEVVRQALTPDYLGRLRDLSLFLFDAGSLDIFRRAGSPLNLRRLALGGFTGYGNDTFLEPLYDLKTLPKLESLDLYAIPGIDPAFAGLVRSPLMGSVRKLLVSGCFLGDGAGHALLESETIGGLTGVRISGHVLSRRMARRLEQKFGPALTMGDEGD